MSEISTSPRPIANEKVVLRSIRRLKKQHKVAPTVREIAADTDLSVSTVHRCLYQLKAAGRVQWEANKPRTLWVVVRPRG